jgi:1,4-dihydroxy-2-naphthoyl-CoA synthase
MITSILPHHCRRHVVGRASLSTLASCDNVLIKRHDDREHFVTTLTLNNPQKYNVLSSAMIDALQLQLDDIAKNDSLSVVVIAATGKAFSAGHDLKEIHSHQTNEETVELFQKCCKLMISVNKLPQPVIAQVQGVATAAGCQLGKFLYSWSMISYFIVVIQNISHTCYVQLLPVI